MKKQLALGEKIQKYELSPIKNEYISQRYLFLKQGKIEQISGLSNLDSNKNIVFHNITIKPGDICSKAVSHVNRGGMVIATGSNRKEAIKYAENAIASIKIKYA